MIINKMNIKVGGMCDLKCRHCCQDLQGRREYPTTVVKEVIPEIRRFALALDKTNNYRDIPLLLGFWGGEPLLYWDTIKTLCKELGDLPVVFTMVSNGTQLTPELAQEIHDLNMSFGLSHDGRHTKKVRGVDVLEDPVVLEAFTAIKTKNISYVIETLEARKKDPDAIGNVFCRAMIRSLTVDLEGSVLRCQNGMDKVADIWTPLDEIEARFKKIVEDKRRNPECVTCDYYYLCAGHCPMHPKTWRKREDDKYCQLIHVLLDNYMAFIDAYLKGGNHA